jgi:hypothetical protein
MTVNVRNKFVFVSFIISTVVVAALGFFFIRALIQGTFELPPADVKPYYFSSRGGILSYSFIASAIAICALSLSAPILAMFIYVNFEKTQSQECVYSIAFLLSCLAESTRLLIPVFNLWITNSSLLIAIARIIFFGRLLAPLSFLICALTSVSSAHYQESGKYFAMLVAFSGVFAFVIPVNSLQLAANCSIEFGFSHIVVAVQAILCLITLFSFVFFGKAFAQKDFLFLTLGYLLFFSGYGILTFADSFFFAVLGTVSFVIGIRFYLGTIHKIYMWD